VVGAPALQLDDFLPDVIVVAAQLYDRDSLALELLDLVDASDGHDAENRRVLQAGNHDHVRACGLRAHDRRAGHCDWTERPRYHAREGACLVLNAAPDLFSPYLPKMSGLFASRPEGWAGGPRPPAGLHRG